MNSTNVSSVSGVAFTLDVREGPIPHVEFSGTGDMEAASVLNRFLSQLHNRLVQAQAKTLEFDVSNLYFMNSSCLKEFLVWIDRIKASGRPYVITFSTNPRLKWQKRSLSTLQRLAPAIVSVNEGS